MSMYLVDDLTGKIPVEPMKKGYGAGLIRAGEAHPEVVALSSDVSGSTGTSVFADKFPDRFVQVGVAEQNLVTVASGMAAMGKKPYAAAYAAFSPGRNWEQIRTTIALNDQPVVLIGTHAGLSDAPDGATHQILEDIALMRVMPNMTVIVPCDSVEAAKATEAAASYDKPVYIRIARDDTPIFTTDKTPFKIGQAQKFSTGKDITVVTTGRMTYKALVAAEGLFKHGIDLEVIHCPTIKPLDGATILHSVEKTKRVLTIEEGQINGGLGAAVAELLGEEMPVPLRRMGIHDRFGESGKPEELFDLFELTHGDIAAAARELIHTSH